MFAVTEGAAANPATPDTANKDVNSGTSPTSQYTVGAGDSLSGIAGAHHVDGGWRHLYDLNHQALGDNPNLIKPGQILNLG